MLPKSMRRDGRSGMAQQKWECPECKRVVVCPINAHEVVCAKTTKGMSHAAKKMVLIEGKLPVSPPSKAEAVKASPKTKR